MSTICRFSLTTVKELLHQCQPGVGKCSILGKKLVNVIKERPLGVLDSHASSIGLSNKARAKTVRFFLSSFYQAAVLSAATGLLRQIIIFFWLPTCIVLQVKISGPISWYDILLVLKYVASSSLTKRLHK